MKKSTSTFAIVSVIMLIAQVQAQLKLDVRLPKGSYLVGEPIEIAIAIVNTTSASIQENLWGATKLRLVDEKGNGLQEAGSPLMYELPVADHVDANDEDLKVIELTEHFGRVFSATDIDRYLDAGKYTLNINFRPTHSKADSTQMSFEVIKPEGDERVVYDKFVDIVKGEARGIYTQSQVADSAEKLHRTYPNSVYTPVILTLLDAVCDLSLKQHQRAMAFAHELVDKYPMSVRGWRMLNGMLRKMDTNLERGAFLDQLQASNSNTSWRKLITKRLKMEESGK